MSDKLIDIIGYTTNLCTDLWTPNDTPEGYEDYKNFLKEIKESQIQTFEPESVNEAFSFSGLDLAGDAVEIPEIPIADYVNQGGVFLYGTPAFSQGYIGVSPMDFQNTNDEFITPDSEGVSPFDFEFFSKAQFAQQETVVLSS